MYKVLIVDDEPIICEGLKRSVRWGDFNCEVAGTASNGLEGLEQMKSLHPDILISDISMNNMDGLAMVAAIRSEFPDVEVCLLTGYRNFEYAQRAIKLGVTRFLLKPSRMDEIEEAITAMTDNLRNRGNLGEQIIDNLWDMRREQDRYLYETFIKDSPKEKGVREGQGRKEAPEGQGRKEAPEGQGRKDAAEGQSRKDAPEGQSRKVAAEGQGKEEAVEGKSRKGSGEGRIRDSEANSYVLKSALVYMAENYTRKLSLNDVADHCYVSSWHLSKLLNQYTGRGFFEIINMIRLDRAKQLLSGTGRKIQDISEEVGFLDVAHFSRIFKNYIGCSPKEYRGGREHGQAGEDI